MPSVTVVPLAVPVPVQPAVHVTPIPVEPAADAGAEVPAREDRTPQDRVQDNAGPDDTSTAAISIIDVKKS
jgi:hypothetical protein